MDYKEFFSIGFHVLGGLGIFLLGMKNMSEGMQAVAGNRLRKLVALVTNNRILAVGVGLAVTSMVQSSSVTTVMVVGMVNAGLMNLLQALGVIMGANIGTTITGWIIALKIGKYGLHIVGVSTGFYLFSKREWVRYTAMVFVGLGMIFLGLALMKEGLAPIKGMPEFEAWFMRFQPDSYLGLLKCCALGAIMTAVVQSSSATLGITIALACKGLLSFDAAAALVVGENVGTTITAYLASLGGSTTARRAAWGHILINVFGALWITSLFPFYLRAIKTLAGIPADFAAQLGSDGFEGKMTTAIAMTHTGFNVLNVLVLLPFTGYFAGLLEKCIPDRKVEEKPRLTYFDITMLDTPALAIHQVMAEVMRMSISVENMLAAVRETLEGAEDEKAEAAVFQQEDNLDIYQKEVVEFLSRLLSGNVPHKVMAEGRRHLRMADEYESIGDYIMNILKMHLKLRKSDGGMSDDGRDRMLVVHDRVAEYVSYVNVATQGEMPEDFLREANAMNDAITRQVKEARAFHMDRVGTEQTNPFRSMIYTDMLNAYRRIKDHALNIAETAAGEK